MSEPALLSDEALLAAIERAASLGAGPANVEHEVGQRAWVNTSRSAERFAVNTANIGPEEGRDLPALREARDVVYWGRPIDTHDPRIAGIVWHQNGGTEVFFGILYPP